MTLLTKGRYLKNYLSVSFGVLIFAVIVFLWFPQYRFCLVEEDKLVENLTVLLYSLSFIIALFLFFRRRNAPKILLLVMLIGLLFTGDETGFGERIFHLEMPHILGLKIDAVHDIVPLGIKILKYFNLSNNSVIMVIIPIMLSGSILIIWHWRRLKERLFKNGIKEYHWLLFIAAGLIIIASLLDFELIKNDIFPVFEEIFEMNASLAMVYAAICIDVKDREIHSP